MATLNENILCKRKELTKQGEVAYFIYNLFKESKREELIIVNIGTDRAKFDCYAPFVGTLLKERNTKIDVYGTLEYPIHAVNLKKKMKYINSKHKNAFIVALDAAVTEEEKNINKIIARNKPVKPRLGIGEDLGSIGDASIIFTINQRDTCCLTDNLRLGEVYKAVDKTTSELLLLEKLLNKNQNNNIIKFA